MLVWVGGDAHVKFQSIVCRQFTLPFCSEENLLFFEFVVKKSRFSWFNRESLERILVPSAWQKIMIASSLYFKDSKGKTRNNLASFPSHPSKVRTAPEVIRAVVEIKRDEHERFQRRPTGRPSRRPTLSWGPSTFQTTSWVVTKKSFRNHQPDANRLWIKLLQNATKLSHWWRCSLVPSSSCWWLRNPSSCGW